MRVVINKPVVLGILLTIVASSVFAEDRALVAELLVGNSKQEIEGSNGDDTYLGVRGTYQVNANFGLEASYNNYGEASYSYVDNFGDTINESAETVSYNFGFKGILPLEGGFSVSARFGLAWWESLIAITDSSLPGIVFDGKDSGNDFYFGIAGHYQITDTLGIGLEYTASEFDVSPDNLLTGLNADLEVSTVALSLSAKL